MSSRIIRIALLFGILGMVVTVVVAFLSPVRIGEIIYRGGVGFGVAAGIGVVSGLLLERFGIIGEKIHGVGENFDVFSSEGINPELLREMLSNAATPSVDDLLGNVDKEELSNEEKRVMKFVEEHPEEAAKVLKDMTEKGS